MKSTESSEAAPARTGFAALQAWQIQLALAIVLLLLSMLGLFVFHDLSDLGMLLLAVAASAVATRAVMLRGEVRLTIQRARALAFMQRAIDVIPHPFYVKGVDGKYLMVNEAFCESCGAPAEQIVGQTAAVWALGEERIAAIHAEDIEVLAGRQVLKEESVPDRSGRVRHQICSKRACEDGAGELVIVGCNVNVSNWREAEAQKEAAWLETSRMHAYMRFVFDALPIPLLVKSQDLRYVLVNEAFAKRAGLSADEMIGKRAADVFGAEAAERLDREDRELFRQSSGDVFVTEMSTAQGGRPRSALVHKALGRDPEGEPVIIISITDITDQRRAEARWQFALEGAGDGVWDWDIANQKIFYSSRWKCMQGYRDEEISDDPRERMQHVHPDDVHAVQDALDAYLSGQSPTYACELRRLTAGGDYIWLLDRGQIVERTPDGRPLRMIGTSTDITHTKKVEAELRAHRDNLREMVAVQTADLVEARDRAEGALAARSQLLSNMSHELRTPMHAVLSFSKLGAERSLNAPSEKLRTYFERISESGSRLLALLDDLLDVSRVESGGMALNWQRMNLERAARDVAREFEADLAARKISVSISAQLDTEIDGDQARLSQAIRKLLHNAIRHSPESSEVSVAFLAGTPDPAHGPMLEMHIADHGPGIPADELETIFSPFVQSSRTRSSAGGAGLGLSVCREILHAHHGSIAARNGPQGGALIVARIPVARTAS